MAKRIVEEEIGKGMTRHVQRRTVYDGQGTPEETRELQEWLEAAVSTNTDWKWLERETGIAERTLAAIEAGQTGDDGEDIFKPRHGAGWYSREILVRVKTIRKAIDRDELHEAALAAFSLGILTTEIRMKVAWEHDVEAALRAEQQYRLRGAKSRKHTDAERVERWQYYRRQGNGKTDADYLAAQDLGEGESTVRGARSAWEKAQTPTLSS